MTSVTTSRGLAAVLLLSAAGCAARHTGPEAEPASELPWDDGQDQLSIADPIEPVNRFFFRVNDRLYFWIIKPVATGYEKICPEPAREGIRNFFSNLSTPGRLANCLLQAKFEGAGTELLRFGLNTTVGVAGFGDPALGWFDLEKRNEDFGQTLGVYGVGPGFYIDWPVGGPSNLRDSLASVVDSVFDPLNYIPVVGVGTGLRTIKGLNEASFHLGEYERLKASAIDAYSALRNAHYQRREHLIDE